MAVVDGDVARRLRAEEALHHLVRLLVANEFYLGVILADEGDAAAMVGLHVVHHEVVDGAVAQNGADIVQKLAEIGHINGIDEGHLFVHY